MNNRKSPSAPRAGSPPIRVTDSGSPETLKRTFPAEGQCWEPDLPADWGKVPDLDLGFFRPLTEKEKQGFTEEEWEMIRAEIGRQSTGPAGNSGLTCERRVVE